MPKQITRALLFTLLLAASPFSHAATPDRNAYALTGGRVIAAPGRVFESGVVVVRGGVIEAVGPAGTPVPADASVVDVTGLVERVVIGEEIGVFLVVENSGSGGGTRTPDLRIMIPPL